jgi:hypothetical protein
MNQVAIISLASSVVFHFTPRLSGDALRPADSDALPALSLVLQPRSLVVFGEDLYIHYLHHIPAAPEVCAVAAWALAITAFAIAIAIAVAVAVAVAIVIAVAVAVAVAVAFAVAVAALLLLLLLLLLLMLLLMLLLSRYHCCCFCCRCLEWIHSVEQL